ncbi:MAG: nitronate monooxygenase [Pseudomonadales bacterium]|nr:nitronate monooxygenase [Pseudomonadales bacterium]
MAGVQDSRLAIAVAKAGGIGSLPCAMLSNEKLHSELVTLQLATAKPINLNFFCHEPPTVDENVEQQWRKLLEPYYKKYQLSLSSIKEGAARIPFSEQIAELIEPFNPPLISFHFGLPSQELLERVKSWGSKIISSATTLEEAEWLEANGVDAVIAQGVEAGGHRGMFLTEDLDTQSSTESLLQEIVARVKIPVIAAGGIASAEDVRTCMRLGASAVQVGTSYLCCREATTTKAHRSLLLQRDSPETAITNLFTGRPARGLINRLMEELGPMNSTVPQFPLAANAIAPLRKTTSIIGSSDFVPLWSGTNRAGCRSCSAADITAELAQAFD